MQHQLSTLYNFPFISALEVYCLYISLYALLYKENCGILTYRNLSFCDTMQSTSFHKKQLRYNAKKRYRRAHQHYS